MRFGVTLPNAGLGDDPTVLAELARTSLRRKIGDLRLALEGRFGRHHALMLRMHLDHIDHLGARCLSAELFGTDPAA